MRRITMAHFKLHVLNSGTIEPIAVANIVKTKTGDSVGCTVQLNISGDGLCNVAADNGRVRIFKNLDDAIKALSAWMLLGSGANQVSSFTLANVAALDAAPFTGDPVLRAQKTLASYTKKRDALIDLAATMTTAIGLMDNVSAAEQAQVIERTAQRDAVNETTAFYVQEIARITALLAA